MANCMLTSQNSQCIHFDAKRAQNALERHQSMFFLCSSRFQEVRHSAIMLLMQQSMRKNGIRVIL